MLSFQTALSGRSTARSTEGLGLSRDPAVAGARGSLSPSEHVEFVNQAKAYPGGFDRDGDFSEARASGTWASGSTAAPYNSGSRRVSPVLRKIEIPHESPQNANRRMSKGFIGGSVPGSRQESPISPVQQYAPSTARPPPVDPNAAADKVSSQDSTASAATQGPVVPSPSLDRNRTLKPTHGRGSSLNSSFDSKQPSPRPNGDPELDANQQPTTVGKSVDDDVTSGPAVPEKVGHQTPPPLPAKEYPSPTLPFASGPSGHAGIQYANDVLPPPLPSTVPVSTSFVTPAGISAPVSDFRKKPLVDVTPDLQKSGRATLHEQAKGLAGLGAHNKSVQDESEANAGAVKGTDDAGKPEEAEGRPKLGHSAGSSGPRAALIEAPAAPELVGPSSMSSIETPSREPSPPPEGEVEARAEWERSMLKQQQKKEKQQDSAGRRATLRGQLKPLQLVPSEGKPTQRGSASQGNSPLTPVNPQSTGAGRSSGSGGGAAMSTQQLQRQQARDQRRSVGAINLAMVGGADLASGSNGPYPVFPSPSTAATPGAAAAGRLYPGMLPQRSLVPPFELQQRPDGLLSGLIGPDGVRRSVNDPEVCLECMMRDEDMIDIHVVGPGLWERESDRDFEEAKRLEEEEDSRRAADRERNGSVTGEDPAGSSITGHSTSQHGSVSREGPVASAGVRSSRTKVRVKRVAQHDDLTAERLKVHTQMNPPASSHRWRTLQNFLAVQAKYIAIEQRVRREEWERNHPAEARAAATSAAARDRVLSAAAMTRNSSSDSAPPLGIPTGQDKVSAAAGVSKRKSITKNRSTSALVSGGKGVQLVNDEDLKPEERTRRDQDIAAAREARRKNATSVPDGLGIAAGASSPRFSGPNMNKQMPTTPAKYPPLAVQTGAVDDPQRRFSSSPVTATSGGAFPAARRPGPGGLTGRGPSSSDLRNISGAMLSSPAMPSTPDSLAPPSAMMYASTPKGFGVRTASQLSLAPSGSMLDMHIALAGTSAENRAGTSLAMPSPMELDRGASGSSRNFFGFPGDGEASPVDHAGRPSFQGEEPVGGLSDFSVIRPNNTSPPAPAMTKKKSKGLKGLFSKMGASNSGGNSRANTTGDEVSKSSGSPDVRRGSMSADSSLAPPPGIGGLLNRARRSTSSLLGGRESVEQVRDMYGGNEPPGMLSPDRFDMGPFQPPLPPERKQSKLVPEESRSPSMMSVPSPGLRSSSSANYIANYFPGPSSARTSSVPQPASSTAGGSYDPRFSSTTVGNSATTGRTSPMSSRTASMASIQSRTNASRGKSTKLPTIDASPGMATQPLDGNNVRGGQAGLHHDQMSMRSGQSGDFASTRQRAESRSSMIDGRSSRFSIASKPVFEQSSGRSQQPQLPQAHPGEDGIPPGRVSMSSAPSRPARNRQRPEASPSGHAAAGLGIGQPPLPQSPSFQQPMHSYGQDKYGQPMPMGQGARDFSGGSNAAAVRQQSISTDSTQSATQAPRKGDRKSKLLRLPFGLSRNKNRSSSLLSSPPPTSESTNNSGMYDTSADAYDEQRPHVPDTYQPRPSFQQDMGARPSFQRDSGLRSSSVPFETQSLRSRSSTTFMKQIGSPFGFGGSGGNADPSGGIEGDDTEERLDTPPASKPRKSMNLFERPRAFSTAGLGDVPPRSQSALGNLPLASFITGKKRAQ